MRSCHNMREACPNMWSMSLLYPWRKVTFKVYRRVLKHVRLTLSHSWLKLLIAKTSKKRRNWRSDSGECGDSGKIGDWGESDGDSGDYYLSFCDFQHKIWHQKTCKTLILRHISNFFWSCGLWSGAFELTKVDYLNTRSLGALGPAW